MSYLHVSKLIVIAGSMALCINCQKDAADSKPEDTWVELINKVDTIDFESWRSGDVLIVRRGYETKDGQLTAKHGSGIFQYRLSSDTIEINNILSSCFCYRSFYFQMNAADDRFIIGNFYDTSLAMGQHMTFKRIK